MYTFNKLLITILFIAGAISGSISQNRISISTERMDVDNMISSKTKAEIIANLEEFLGKYSSISDFWNEELNVFNEGKYSAFMGLFADSAMVQNDVSTDPSFVLYNDYAEIVFHYMYETGLKNEIQNIHISEILIDDSGFYKVNLAFDKIMYLGLNKKNKVIHYKKGKALKMSMVLDIASYLLSDIKIQQILIQEEKSFLQDLATIPKKIKASRIFENIKAQNRRKPEIIADTELNPGYLPE